MLSYFTAGDPDHIRIDIPDELVISPTPCKCIECGRMIPIGERHYDILQWEVDEYGDEQHIAAESCCEVCGDLALSFMALGYCWCFGDLRADIQEMNEL